MDQIKIGKFIAEQRKKQGLTQLELAEKLYITDRAVSKWENGKSMPDSSIMLPLCKELNISVTDLLNGEVVSMNENDKKTEMALIEMAKEKERSDKHLLRLEMVFASISIVILLGLCMLASFAQMEDWLRFVLIGLGVLPAIVFTPFAIAVEQRAGFYECKNCGNRYVPKYGSVFMSMHLGTTRYLRCPKCGKQTWSKKVLSQGANGESTHNTEKGRE